MQLGFSVWPLEICIFLFSNNSLFIGWSIKQYSVNATLGTVNPKCIPAIMLIALPQEWMATGLLCMYAKSQILLPSVKPEVAISNCNMSKTSSSK